MPDLSDNNTHVNNNRADIAYPESRLQNLWSVISDRSDAQKKHFGAEVNTRRVWWPRSPDPSTSRSCRSI